LIDKVIGVQYLSAARLTADLAERDIIMVGAEAPYEGLGHDGRSDGTQLGGPGNA